jgi:hypothetical protein
VSQRRGAPGLTAGLAALGLISASCRPQAGPRQEPAGPQARLEPFRVKPDSAGTGQRSQIRSQILIADLDADGRADSLCLMQQDERPQAAGELPLRRVRVTVWCQGEPAPYNVVDDVWALEGEVSVRIDERYRPPAFAVGVQETGERYWYRWNGKGFEQASGVEPQFE